MKILSTEYVSTLITSNFTFIVNAQQKMDSKTQCSTSNSKLVTLHCFEKTISQGKYHPKNERFADYAGSNDQVCEQSWNVWHPGLKSVVRKAGEDRAGWYLYVFMNARNEWVE